ncbi:MAG: TonB-dependent receptor [Deltaproteobacteria bacterium]|nr:TonB-dependent receptor [Deltaproteobacteria bacterium]
MDDPADLDSPQGPARAAARLPATRVAETGGPGRPVTVSVRGSDPAATLSVLDGVPLNSPFLGGADLAGLALLPLESLTVARGGLSAAFGTDAVGGVVDARVQGPLDWPGTEVSLLAGSFGTARLKAAHAATAAGGRVGALASAGFLKSGGDFPYIDTNGHSRERTHAGVAALDGLVKVEAAPGRGHRVSLLAEGFAGDREVPGMEQYPSDTARQRDSRVVVAAAWDGPGPFRRDGRSAARVFVRRVGFRYDDSAPPMGPAVSNVLVSWGVGGDASASVRPLSWLAVSAGAGGTCDLASARRLRGSGYDERRTTASAWAGVEVGREERLVLLTAVVRGQWAGGMDFGATGGFVAVPRGTVASRPVRWLRLFADAARAFRLPTLEELYFDAGFVRGNPDLDPEDSFTWDAGLELLPADGVSVKAAYFETRSDNLILFLPRSAYLTRAENSGSALLRGVEASASARAGPVGLAASYTFLDARDRTAGLSLPNRPRHAAAGEVFGEAGPVRASVRVAGQTGFFQNRFESLREEGRVTADLRLEVRPIPALLLAVDVQNVSDVRDAVDALQQPLPGRAFYGSVKVSL